MTLLAHINDGGYHTKEYLCMIVIVSVQNFHMNTTKSPVGDMNKCDYVSVCMRRRWRQRQQQKSSLFVRETENSKDLVVVTHTHTHTYNREGENGAHARLKINEKQSFSLARTFMPLLLLRYLSFNLPIFIQKLKKSIRVCTHAHTHQRTNSHTFCKYCVRF